MIAFFAAAVIRTWIYNKKEHTASYAGDYFVYIPNASMNALEVPI